MPSKVGKAAAGDLYSLAARRKPLDGPETVDVDVSPWFGEGASLTLRRPKLADKYASLKGRLKVVKAHQPTWADELCATVAALASCHVSPDPGEKGPIPFYIGLADDSDDSLYQYVQDEFTAAFQTPDASEVTSDDASSMLRYCAFEYMKRHPDELGEMEPHVLDDLMAHHKMKLEERDAIMKRLGPLAGFLGLGK
jgi:hypothetical protein